MDGALQCAAIAVGSIDVAARDFEQLLGLERVGPPRESEKGFHLRWQGMGSGGVAFFDLLESTSEDGMVAKFVHEKGEGVYLVSIGVPDVAAAAADLLERGARLIGVDGLPEKVPDMFWIHPSSTHGVLIEVLHEGHRDEQALAVNGAHESQPQGEQHGGQ
jgi:methylmalonyl-CoA/ethylmalonyl-CoA epimerase